MIQIDQEIVYKKMNILILCCCFTGLGVAQMTPTDSTESAINSIEIIKDNRIDKLNETYVSTYELKGFRVQIFSGNKKQPARQARLKFTKMYNKTKAYETYEQPNFKVRVGDFKTKIEALKFKKELANHFPNAFIVEDSIEFKD